MKSLRGGGMARLTNQELMDARHKMGIYSVSELCCMFECGRAKIDVLLNKGQLKYISPNGRTRYVYLNEYLELISKNDKNVGGNKK